MTTNVKIGVAVVGGYFLGRTRKAKLAIGLGMFLAGRKLNLDPRHIGKVLANSPVLGSLNEQVRRELVETTRSAATTALTERATSLAESLHQRTLELNQGSEPEAEDAAVDDEAAPAEAKKKTATRTRSASEGARKKSAAARKRASAPRRSTASTGRKSRGGSDD
ncbi:hypothetical protein [Streptomyces sp. NPDC127084]|uniref:hypothetical protein n=1 Tax=Streptomyces sp. NPDC127084 TaxID=3347133 RepID=UPI0036468E56